jgi:hypothetical protein
MFKIAVFCGSNFEKSIWKPGKRATCLAVFGMVKMDFQQAQLEPGVTHVICVNVFGVTRLRVAEGIPVNVSGVSLFGRTKDDRDEGDIPKSNHTLGIACFNVFGATAIFN